MAQPGRPPFTYYPLTSLPKSMDIVWCRFPEREAPGVPGPKSRPALVRAVALNDEETKGVVNVTFGTGRLKANRALDLQIQNFRSIEECGLEKATRFDLDRTIWLPWTVEFFGPAPGYTQTILGRLDPQSCMQLEALKVARRAIASQRKPK